MNKTKLVEEHKHCPKCGEVMRPTQLYHCDLSAGEALNILEDIKPSRDSLLQELMVEVEGKRVTNNVTIPVCRKCDFFGANEDYCPKCGDNLTPESRTGYVEKIKNSVLDDVLSLIKSKRRGE